MNFCVFIAIAKFAKINRTRKFPVLQYPRYKIYILSIIYISKIIIPMILYPRYYISFDIIVVISHMSGSKYY